MHTELTTNINHYLLFVYSYTVLCIRMHSLSLSPSLLATGLLWSKQFYHYDVSEGGEATAAESSRMAGRNSSSDWAHLVNNDVISMPDKWEYPWVVN